MNNIEVLKKGFITRLVLLILLVFIVFSSVSGLLLYFNTYRPLDTTYSASLAIISEIKEDLLSITLTISSVFYIFIVIGIVLLSVLYTHRIAGPLQRIKLFAEAVRRGDLTTELKFRKNDAVHSFGESLNRMTESWRGRIRSLASHMDQLEDSVKECKSLAENGEETADVQEKIASINNEIQTLLKKTRK